MGGRADRDVERAESHRSARPSGGEGVGPGLADILHPAKDDSAEAAIGLVVQVSVAPWPGWPAMASVTLGGGGHGVAAGVLDRDNRLGGRRRARCSRAGWVVKANWVAAPTVMLKVGDVAAVSPVDAAAGCSPGRGGIWHPAKVATPAVALGVGGAGERGPGPGGRR